MYLERNYKMRNWYGFDDHIFNAAKRFYAKHGIFPNTVVFNEHTYQQVCFLTSVSPKRACLVDDEGEDFIEIGIFKYIDCALQCAISEELNDKEFLLVFNDEPDDDDDSDDDTKPEPPVNNYLDEILHKAKPKILTI